MSMLQPDDTVVTTEILRKTELLLFAIALGALEAFVPRIPLFPWLKPGIANAVTIVWIIRYGAIDALLFSALRVWIAGFFTGFSLLTLTLALGGGIMATLCMGAAWQIFKTRKLLGSIGLGMIGAIAHNLGQLCVVYLLIAQNGSLFLQFPVMILASIFFGAIVGSIAPAIMRLASQPLPAAQPILPTKIKNSPHRQLATIASTLIFLFSIALLLIPAIAPQALIALAITLIVQIMNRGSLSMLLYPFTRFWMLFLFIGLLYLFFSFGTRVDGFSWITREGVIATVTQWLRLFSWIQLSFILTRLRFHQVFFGALTRLFPGHGQTLFAGMLSLEIFPQLFALTQKSIGRLRISHLARPRTAMQGALKRLHSDVLSCIFCDTPSPRILPP